MIKICSITHEPYIGFGNNANPFYGRCNDYANHYYVIPARLAGVRREDLNKITGYTEEERNDILKEQIDEFFKENKEFKEKLDKDWERMLNIRKQIA